MNVKFTSCGSTVKREAFYMTERVPPAQGQAIGGESTELACWTCGSGCLCFAGIIAAGRDRPRGPIGPHSQLQFSGLDFGPHSSLRLAASIAMDKRGRRTSAIS